MKVFFFLLLPIFAFGQDIEFKINESGKYYYQRIIENEKDEEQNYKAVKQAIIHLYTSNKAIQYDEKDKIIVEGTFEVKYLINNVVIEHTITIDIKEKKVRFTFLNFTAQYHYTHEHKPFESKPTMSWPQSYWDKIKERSMVQVQGIMKEFNKSLNSELEEDDDW